MIGRVAAALAAGLAAQGVAAQSWRVIPQVTLTETYSDNVALVSVDRARDGWISDIAPGIRVERQGPRAKLFLDYQFHEVLYASQSRLNNQQRFLNATANVEALENWLFIDAKASQTQQNRSAFDAAVAPNTPSASANRVETTVYQLSPYVRGRIPDVAVYQLRFNATAARADDAVLPQTTVAELVGRIRNESLSAKVGWAIDANALSVKNDFVGRRDDSRVRASVIYAVNPQLHLSAIEGYERTDFAGGAKENGDTPGVGIEWSPSDRTQLAAVGMRRFFGNGYNVSATHRTPLTAWRFTANRDAVVLPNLVATLGPGSIYSVMYDLLTSAIPEPNARALAVRRRLEDTGIPTNTALSSGFLTERPLLDQSSELSVAFLGSTNTVTLGVTLRHWRALGQGLRGADSFAIANDIRQQGANANWSHRLTPLTTLTLAATSLRTEALDVANLDTRQRVFTAFLATRLGPRSSATFGVRHLRFDSTQVAGYSENAVFASFTIRH